MFTSVISGAVCGIESFLTEVEVDCSKSLPGFEMVGFLGNEVKEAKERVRIALKNSEYPLPPIKITVNISPANIRKEGTGFDLAIAIGILETLGILRREAVREILFLGELGLSGEVKYVKGVLPIALEAKKNQIKTIIVPYENLTEVTVPGGIEGIGVKNLKQVLEYLRTNPEQQTMKKEEIHQMNQKYTLQKINTKETAESVDFSEINGQETVKRAAVIAAAGFHHLLLVGPPGSGKTMIAKRMPTILPPLSQEESLEVSKIYSVAGLLSQTGAFMKNRPYLNPHHTITAKALTGGGRIPKPGVISLAHRGILFLDELPEFGSGHLDLLRQPLEERKVQIARAYGSYTYPADFMLLAAMNPCPCGYFPDVNRCRCTPFEMKRYLSKISGPILDRIDITVKAPRIELDNLQNSNKNKSSQEFKNEVMEARERQEFRYRELNILYNGELGINELKKYCKLGVEENSLLEAAFKTLNLSARAYHKIIKVARTIADLEGVEKISKVHIAEAICYRSNDIQSWKK